MANNVVVTLNLPRKLVFGDHCLADFIAYFVSLPFSQVLILADPSIKEPLAEMLTAFRSSGKICIVNDTIASEPTVADFLRILDEAENHQVDAVVGIGGGSVLDVAKLTAALCHSEDSLEAAFGIGNIRQRKVFLACLPTTAGTGSEVSPNSILLDESEQLKKAAISPFLVPDASFVDPVLTYTVPPAVTASTGLDAFTHCIEAFANVNAHPVLDLYALEGIRLIGGYLKRAYNNGFDVEARRNVALGSMYGGICLGPVNTAAVHAMAYPLGSMFGIPHGVSNAILLPHVLLFNLASGIQKYAEMARAIGVPAGSSDIETAAEGIKRIEELCRELDIPGKLSVYNVTEKAIPVMAESAMSVQRLLRNNLRELTIQDMQEIYQKIF